MARAPRELPRRLSQKTAKALLEAEGWVQALSGNHQIKMDKPGMRPITLPQHKGQDYAAGLTQAIYRQAGLKKDAGEDEG